MVSRAAPLLPVHKPANGFARQGKRKGSVLLRVFILSGLLGIVGYAYYGVHHVGHSTTHKPYDNMGVSAEIMGIGRTLQQEDASEADSGQYLDVTDQVHQIRDRRAEQAQAPSIENPRQKSSGAYTQQDPQMQRATQQDNSSQKAATVQQVLTQEQGFDSNKSQASNPAQQVAAQTQTETVSAPVTQQQQQQQQATVAQTDPQQTQNASPDSSAVVDQTAVAAAVNALPKPEPRGFYALSAPDIDGRERSFSEFAGKVTLVVNVASACGFTDENYKGIIKSYEKYHAYGFEVFGFPCNQFGNQEPGSEAEIKEFCASKYQVPFPMFSKVEVNGPNTHPVYQYLKRYLPVSEGGGGGEGPGRDLVWNFNKFLVDKKGDPVKFFYQNYDSGAIENELYKLLQQQI